MEFVRKKIDELVPADYNPRKDLQEADKEYQDIKRGIQTYGLVIPLIMNKRTGNLVNGHQRLKVLKALGWTEVDVSVVDMDDKKEKALNLALSRIDGDFDNKALTNVMSEIRAAAISFSEGFWGRETGSSSVTCNWQKRDSRFSYSLQASRR